MKDFAVLIAGVQACRAVHDRILIHPCSIVNFFFLVGCREGKVLFCLFVLLLLINVLTVFYPFINIFFLLYTIRVILIIICACFVLLNGEVFVIAILLPSSLSVLMSLQSSLVLSLWKGQAMRYGPFHCSTREVFTHSLFWLFFPFHSSFSSTNLMNNWEAGPDNERMLRNRRLPKWH